MTRPVDQAKRQTILDALTGDPRDYPNIGTPPYSVGFLSERLAMDPSNLRKLLLRLEKDGLVVSERSKVPTWNAIAGDHIDRTCLCFWNSATMTADKAAAAEWSAASDEKSKAAIDEMLRVMR